ncbi:unnamed protein product [Clonostachys rosea]|uniref:C2 domain-containing protein n=1 Tax=Bionectria ochroleuca TaxID=29856 RepID=A0ABY6UPS5_BIOOC|nr:unnamed protein product [Clonostachys rosea]
MAEQNNATNGTNELPAEQVSAPEPATANGPSNEKVTFANGNTNGGDGKAAPRKTHTFGRPLRALTKKGPPGGYDNTPLPDVPQGYTLKFVFHRASNLPPSDLSSMSSDPFLVATLKASGLKRHKEDPDLTHRTRTLRRTTEPEWEDEWIVANVPASGFQLKCRIYDEDYPDSDDRLGNVTIKVPRIEDQGDPIPLPGKEFEAKRHMISKRAFLFKGITGILTHNFHMTPRLWISIEILGKSDPPYAQMCTLGPTTYFKHFSPMIGRLVGTKVDVDEENEGAEPERPASKKAERKAEKYDFQAIEMQLQGPVPPRLYHRYVEFRPIISSMFMSKGLRGKILNAALHKQHRRVYNFDSSTEYGAFEARSDEASLQFLKFAQFGEGSRIFTYVITLDALMRFTETGHEFGIDLLSKHTMHSNVARYVACSGEFFVQKHRHSHREESRLHEEESRTHEEELRVHEEDRIDVPRPSTSSRRPSPVRDVSHYELVIDNDSGTYRPDKRILPDLQQFLEDNLPGLKITVKSSDDDELQSIKEARRKAKKQSGRIMNVVQNVSDSSLSSAVSDLDDRENWESGQPSKREAALAAVENPALAKQAFKRYMPSYGTGASHAAGNGEKGEKS